MAAPWGLVGSAQEPCLPSPSSQEGAGVTSLGHLWDFPRLFLQIQSPSTRGQGLAWRALCVGWGPCLVRSSCGSRGHSCGLDPAPWFYLPVTPRESCSPGEAFALLIGASCHSPSHSWGPRRTRTGTWGSGGIILILSPSDLCSQLWLSKRGTVAFDGPGCTQGSWVGMQCPALDPPLAGPVLAQLGQVTVTARQLALSPRGFHSVPRACSDSALGLALCPDGPGASCDLAVTR